MEKIYVSTMNEAIRMAMIAENEYNSDKDFKGVTIYVK